MQVRIRQNFLRLVRPEAEQLDGNVYKFRYGWMQGEGDPYPGEVAWVPCDETYPNDAPHWIASGDLARATSTIQPADTNATP